MAENNTILVVAVLAVLASLAAAGFSFYALQGPRIVGFATNTDTGVANLTVDTAVEIEFTDDAIEWGSGRVDTGDASATLDTDAGTVTDGNWTVESTGLTLENKGNINVTVDIAAGKTAAVFLGGTSPDYEWKVSSADGACKTAGVTAYENTNTSARACNNMGYLDAADTLNIDIKLVVPYDSKLGYLSDTITATAAAVV